MSHTPGPWRIVQTADDRTFIDTEESNDNFIAQIDRNIPEYEDNAHLIAAAPKLLSALKAIKALYDGEWDQPDLEAKGPLMIPQSENIYKWVKEALTQAEGKGLES